MCALRFTPTALLRGHMGVSDHANLIRVYHRAETTSEFWKTN